jgi:formylglycine-generating enzyme required for sulfatase activity
MAEATLQRLDMAGLLDLQRQAAREAGVPVSFRDRSREDVPVPELQVIPAGEFEMGSDASEYGHERSESPRRRVLIERPFALGRHPVTLAEFAAFQEATGWRPRPAALWPRSDRQPVFNIRLLDAEAYLAWLGAVTGKHYRLPTEAEWEYAARAGTRTPFAFGESAGCRDVHFNSLFPYEERRERRRWYIPLCIPTPRPLDVGGFPSNLWGLHDMHGNVQEFTSSPWRDSHAACRATASTGGRRTRSGWW